MWRSDKKPIVKTSTTEKSSNQTESQAWQSPAPPVEIPVETRNVPVQPPAQPRAIGEKDAMARDIKDGVLNGFVGNGTVMSGEAVFKGMLRVDGNLTGRVTSDDGTLLVGTNGQVDADVNVCIATIHGTVNGDIIATKRIELGRTAKVVGNIQTPALVVEQGAIFEGGCQMVMGSKEMPKKANHSLGSQRRDLADISDRSEIIS